LFDSLSLPDKLTLFTSADPTAVGPELVTVIKVLYTNLPNDTAGNQLLRAMDRPLVDLKDPNARSLSIEIEQWLQGRERYNDGKYDEAVEAYTVAIQINPRNSGALIDRALAYAHLDQSIVALDDLAAVIRLERKPSLESTCATSTVK